MTAEEREPDVETLVIGGGLAGLCCAARLAHEGRSVRVLERAPHLGGRARTSDQGGHSWNLGPHALYARGPGKAVLDDLGVDVAGHAPELAGEALYAGGLHALPTGPLSLLRTSMFGWGAKLAGARLLASLPRIRAERLLGRSCTDWIEEQFGPPETRALVRALLRLATYQNAPDRMCAAAALAQLQSAMVHDVLYIDGGWQSLVDGLARIARDGGATLSVETKVEKLTNAGGGWRVDTSDGEVLLAKYVLLALAPGACHELAPDISALSEWKAAATPVRAACLDLALERLPRPGANFVLGIDRPLYLSVHSAYAELAPEGRATVHVARYLAPNESGNSVAGELEELCDLAQPGWRELAVAQRFLPELSVSNALVEAESGGLSGRPGPIVPDAPGLLVAGDWVGPEGMLADAALSSADRAARLILAAAG